jgi:hypothetical protein
MVVDEPEISGKKNRTNSLAMALKTAFPIVGVIIVLSTILNIPLYLMADYLPLSLIGFPGHGFMDVWLLSFFGAIIFVELALMKYISLCGAAFVYVWYL